MRISIDPGKRTGFALWEQNTNDNWRLVFAATCAHAQVGATLRQHRPTLAYIEWPAVWHNTQASAASQQVLIERAATVETLCTVQHIATERIAVGAWKGNLNKTACHRRIPRLLFPSEEPVIKNCDKHALDAIGLGLVALQRAERGLL